jgi:hypothetical protein
MSKYWYIFFLYPEWVGSKYGESVRYSCLHIMYTVRHTVNHTGMHPLMNQYSNNASGIFEVKDVVP